MVKKDWIEKISSMREKYEKESVENVNFNKKGDYTFIIPKETEEEAIERYKNMHIEIAHSPVEIKGSINMKRIEEQNNIIMEMLKEIEEEDKKNDR